MSILGYALIQMISVMPIVFLLLFISSCATAPNNTQKVECHYRNIGERHTVVVCTPVEGGNEDDESTNEN